MGECDDADPFIATVTVGPIDYSKEKRGRAMHPDPLGSNSCTWGPSFWCDSEENAEMCGYDYALCPAKAEEEEEEEEEEEDSSSWTVANCREGPDFYCASEEKASYCNYEFSKCATTTYHTSTTTSSYVPTTTLPAYTTS